MNQQQKGIHYFPGHMAKALRNLGQLSSFCDILVEIADARAPLSSRNPLLAKISPEKPRLILLNKDDLADPLITQKWLAWFKNKGIPASVKVVAGAGDNAAAAVGTGVVGEGGCNISLGTSGTLFISSKSFGVDPHNALHAFAHADGGWHLMGCMLSAASCNKWLCDEILKTTDYAAEQKDITAEKLGNNHVYFLPYLMGERSPINDPNAKGAFYGIELSHKRADMTKAVVDGICFGLKDCYDNILGMGAKADFARVIGGGSRSDKWVQILADITGLELRRINTSDGAGLGAVILAMVGCGEFGSLDEACSALIADTDVFLPDERQHMAYAERFAAFKDLYARLK